MVSQVMSWIPTEGSRGVPRHSTKFWDIVGSCGFAHDHFPDPTASHVGSRDITRGSMGLPKGIRPKGQHNNNCQINVSLDLVFSSLLRACRVSCRSIPEQLAVAMLSFLAGVVAAGVTSTTALLLLTFCFSVRVIPRQHGCVPAPCLARTLTDIAMQSTSPSQSCSTLSTLMSQTNEYTSLADSHPPLLYKRCTSRIFKRQPRHTEECSANVDEMALRVRQCVSCSWLTLGFPIDWPYVYVWPGAVTSLQLAATCAHAPKNESPWIFA